MDYIINQIPLLFILTFLSIVFIQSALDKIFNWKGNLEFTTSTLTNKFPPMLVRFALLNVLLLEFTGGFGSLGGVVEIMVGNSTLYMAKLGTITSSLALLILLLGQRISQNYVDAKTIVIYFIVCLFGLQILF
ncbi:MAG: DoxX family protein [Bacteroidota bacterium]|nr:DoxX family protein [Bacteroidota bacterium]